MMRAGWSRPVHRKWRFIFRRLHPGIFIAFGPIYFRKR